MDEKTRKLSIYFVLGLVLAIAGYQTLTNYKPKQETQREKDYLESNKHSLKASDSSRIERFYEKLCLAHDLVSTDSSEQVYYSTIDQTKLNNDFVPRLCTVDYLSSICDAPPKKSKQHEDWKSILETINGVEVQELNNLLGAEDFGQNIRLRNWNGSVRSEINYAEKDRFLMVVQFTEMLAPKFNPQSDTYDSGFCYGQVKVVDLHAGKIVALISFKAQNDQQIRSIALKEDAMNDKLKARLLENIRNELDKCAITLFNRSFEN